ncbi:MAG: hypothetical protein E7598_06495 [Ruminococcaceae bacterium]|nr:hypothetical protein [Oscillospiraceae bacterium]
MSEPNLNDILSGGGLSSLLQNPDIAAKLPRIMEALGPVMAEMRSEGGEKTEEDTTDDKSENPIGAALAAVNGKGKNRSSARRCTLLKALEPYLSPNRREAMEYIIKVTSLIDLLSEVM